MLHPESAARECTAAWLRRRNAALLSTPIFLGRSPPACSTAELALSPKCRNRPLSTRVHHRQLLRIEPGEQLVVLGLLARIHLWVSIRGCPRVEVDDSFHLCLAQLLGTAETRLHRCVDCGALNSDPKPRSTQQGVLLRVDADTKVVARSRRKAAVRISTPKTTSLKTVLHALGYTVVSRGDHPVVQHGDSPDPVPRSVRLSPNSERDSHVVRVAVGKLLSRRCHQDLPFSRVGRKDSSDGKTAREESAPHSHVIQTSPFSTSLSKRPQRRCSR